MYLDEIKPSLLIKIPSGVSGTLATLKIMQKLVQKFKKHPVIRQKAQDLVSHLRSKDWIGEVSTIHNFVKDNVRYLRDINGVETLHFPTTVLEKGSGDCDDQSVLVASLLESIGHPTRFTVIGPRTNKYSHVFAETRIGDKWISVETTEDVPLGWRPKFQSIMSVYN